MSFLRAIHLDLKAQTVHFPFLCRTIEDCAKKGFQAVFLEYQDKFPFSGELSELAAPDALTVSEVESLKALCRAHNMEIIPIMQSIGHMYWVTRFERYAALGENFPVQGPGSHSLCPSKPESLALFGRLVEQVLALHPECRRFHIGGDEVKFSDRCPDCAGKDQGALLGEYYKNALALIRQKGIQPVMWADMVLKYENVAEYLPKDTLLVDWEYQKGLTRKNQRRFYGEESPLSPADDSSFATTELLIQKGFSVLTAPALRSWGDSAFLPRNVHLDNCVQAYYTALDSHAAGILVTSWAVRRCPWQLTEPVLCALAELFRDERATFADAKRRYAQEVFHSSDPSVAMISYTLSRAVEAAKAEADFLSSRQDFMDAATGLFLSTPIEEHLSGLDLRHNTAVQNAYLALAQAGKTAKDAILAIGTPTEAAQALQKAAETAISCGETVAQLCDRSDDPLELLHAADFHLWWE